MDDAVHIFIRLLRTTLQIMHPFIYDTFIQMHISSVRNNGCPFARDEKTMQELQPGCLLDNHIFSLNSLTSYFHFVYTDWHDLSQLLVFTISLST